MALSFCNPGSFDTPANVFEALTAEWNAVASGPKARQAIQAWAEMCPTLAGFASPAELVATIGRMGDPDRSCALLADLLQLAAIDGLAARAVLQALLPGLRATANRRWATDMAKITWAGRSELDTDTLAAAWQAIAANLGERHERPAAAIIRRVERELRSACETMSRTARRSLALDEVSAARMINPAVQDTDDWRFVGAMVEAVRFERLNPATGALAFDVAALGHSVGEASRRHGFTRREAQRRLDEALRVLIYDERPTAAPPTCRSLPHTDVFHEEKTLMPPRTRLTDLNALSRQQTLEEPAVLPLLLTVNQAAELLGIGRSTLYELMDAGELKSVKRGASRRVPLQAVHDYVDRLLAAEDEDGGRRSVFQDPAPRHA
jgi:excisionase family DNA binding protein